MAKLPIDIHPEAQLEQDEAFEWYCERSISAGERFVQLIEQARSVKIHRTRGAFIYTARVAIYLSGIPMSLCIG